MNNMPSLVEHEMEKQKNEFELFLRENGVGKSFKQYSAAIEKKICSDRYKTEHITKHKNLFACTDPKEFDAIMPKLLSNPLFLKDKNDHSKGSFSDHINAIKYYSKFLHKKIELFSSKLSSKRMIVIDMYSGSYTQNRTGHEIFNLEKNPVDGKFYGYCPPDDAIDVCKRFGAKNREDTVNDILVVYVAKKKESKNREIIGFIPNAKIFGISQSGKMLSRTFFDAKKKADEVASYSVKGDILIDLRNETNKFEIEIEKYSSYIFRRKRYYGNKYPKLDKNIISYIERILNSSNDDIDDQVKIQQSDPATPSEILGSVDRELNIVSNSQGNAIAKDGRISKAALEREHYTCQINPEHKTFQTTRGVPYMEGHHLIPCTVTNAEYFMSQNGKNIDCLENIVCICPTCHRAVHFGDSPTKETMLKAMYAQQAAQLMRVGITITEEVLLALYKC